MHKSQLHLRLLKKRLSSTMAKFKLENISKVNFWVKEDLPSAMSLLTKKQKLFVLQR
jgi:hypothetical protein